MDESNAIVKSNYDPSNKRILYHLSKGMNTNPDIGQRFLGRGAPLVSFKNTAIDDLQLEVFWCTYMRDMELRPDIPPNRELNRKLLQFLQSDPNWSDLSNWFAGRKLVSSAVAYETTQRLLDMVNGLSEALETISTIEKMRSRADSLDQQVDDMDGEDQQSGDDEDEENEESETSDDLRQQAQDLRDKADELEKQFEDQQSDVEDELEDQMSSMARSSAINAGQEFGEQVSAFMKSWGIEDGAEIELPIDDIKALMSMMGEQSFGQLSYLMGRIFDLSVKVLTGRSNIDLVLDEPGYTDEVWDIDMTELAKLSPTLPDPVRMQTLQNYYRDGGMWGMTRTAQAKNQGTFIAAVDESSSMDSPIGRDEDGRYDQSLPSCAVFSKALVLGLMNAAVLNEQEFYAIGFSDASRITDIVSNRSSLSSRMKFGLHHFDGGTDFDRPLNICLDIFDGLDESGKEASDILFITDGEAELSHDVVERLYEAKEQYGVRLILLLIGEDADMDGRDEVIETHADIILSFKNIDETAETIARALWDSR